MTVHDDHSLVVIIDVAMIDYVAMAIMLTMAKTLTMCDVMKPIDIALIQARRKKLDDEAAAENARFQWVLQEHQRAVDAHNQRLAEIAQESKELEIAEKVFAKLTKEVDEADLQPDGATNETGGRKPEGTPPVSEMIREALAHARTHGQRGLKPAEILSYVQGKYWPGARPTDVGPIAWRMWDRRSLEKRKGRYSLPKEEEPAVIDDDADNADEADNEADGSDATASLF